MPNLLSPAELSSYEENGYLFPIRIMTSEKAAYYRRKLEQTQSLFGGEVPAAYGQKSNLVFTWADELVHEPLLLDAVADLIGPDVLLWSTELFIKPPKNKKYVSWHQDDTYWHLSPPIEVTAWIALGEVTLDSGPVRYVPGSHKVERYDVVNEPSPDNMLQSGQIAQGVDEALAVDAVLEAGEMSVHHTKTLHASGPNRSDQPRIGLAARFVPAFVKQLRGRESAMLMRGKNVGGHFELEPRPAADLDSAAMAAHRDAVTRRMANMRGNDYQAVADFD